MLFLAIQLAFAQRTVVCAASSADQAKCPDNSTVYTWNVINLAIENITGDVTLYVIGSRKDNRIKLHEGTVGRKSLKILSENENTTYCYLHVETRAGGYFDMDISEAKLNITDTMLDLWMMGLNSSVLFSGPWESAPRVNIFSSIPLQVALDTSSIKLDIVSHRGLEIEMKQDQTKISGTLSLLGDSSLYQNRITYSGSSQGRVALYITNLHVIGFLELDSDKLDLTVRYMNSYGWESFPIKFALGLSGLATLTVEKKWTSPWASRPHWDEPSWDDDFHTEDLSSATTAKNGQQALVSAKTLDRDEPDDIVVTLLNKVKCADGARTCYVTDADTSALTSRNWTIVTGPSGSFEFRRYDYELYLSNATDNTPYGFEAINHIFDITAKAGEFNVDRTTLTIFAKSKPSEHPFHICYAENERNCPNKQITTLVTAANLADLSQVLPSEIKNLMIAVETNMKDKETIDLNKLPSGVQSVVIFSDEDRRTVKFEPNPSLGSLSLQNVQLASTVSLSNPVVTLISLKCDQGVSLTIGSDTTLRTTLSLYKEHFDSKSNTGKIKNLELLGMEDYKYVYFYSDKWVISKKKSTNHGNEGFTLSYEKVGNFSFELGDELEEIETGAKLLSWWDDWHDEAERLNLIPVFNGQQTLTVRPITIISTEDSIEIFISEEWKNVTFDKTYGDAITISHGKYSVTINSEYDDIPVATDGYGIVRIWRNLEVDNQGRPIFRPDLVMSNGEYGFSVSFDGTVEFPFGKLDISGNCSLVLVNKNGQSSLTADQVYCKRGGFFRFTQLKITGKLTLEADSDLVPENATNPEIEFTASTDVELKWFRGYIPMIDLGRDASKLPHKIVLKYDEDAENDLTAAGYNQIWQSEKNREGQVVVRGVNMDCDAWMKLVSFESDIKGFSSNGAFGFECKAVNDSLSASRLLAGEVENGVYMKMNTALTDSDLKKGPNVGAIVGGVIGGLAFIAIVAVIIFFVIKKRKDRSFSSEEKAQLTRDNVEP